MESVHTGHSSESGVIIRLPAVKFIKILRKLCANILLPKNYKAKLQFEKSWAKHVKYW